MKVIKSYFVKWLLNFSYLLDRVTRLIIPVLFNWTREAILGPINVECKVEVKRVFTYILTFERVADHFLVIKRYAIFLTFWVSLPLLVCHFFVTTSSNENDYHYHLLQIAIFILLSQIAIYESFRTSFISFFTFFTAIPVILVIIFFTVISGMPVPQNDRR